MAKGVKKKKKIFFQNKKMKRSFIVNIVLIVLVLLSAIRELYNGNFTNTALCFLSLFLFAMPRILENTLKIEFPSIMESIIYLFIFAAEILGEINNFYQIFPYWDTILHAINGFICAGLGFSLIDILNKRSLKFNISPLYLAIASFCFSMTIGVCWEFFEFTNDRILKSDMQKDEVVYNISSVSIDESNWDKPHRIKDIKETIIITEDGKEYRIKGYLDIGLYDTIEDLFVNFTGALVFSIFGFVYVYSRDERSIIIHFIPKKIRNRRRRKKKELEAN